MEDNMMSNILMRRKCYSPPRPTFYLRNETKITDFHLVGKNRFMKINQPIYPKRKEDRRNFYDSKLDLSSFPTISSANKCCPVQKKSYSRNSSMSSLFSVNSSVTLKPMRFSMSSKY